MILEAIGPGGKVDGWRYLWLKYVSGFDATQHCARGLVGPYSKRVGVDMPTRTPRRLDEARGFHCVYLCGVAARGGWAANLHLAVLPSPGEVAEATAANGERYIIHDARKLDIPMLPKGYAGMPSAFTTCRNWQFGVKYYGLSSRRPTSAQPARPIFG